MINTFTQEERRKKVIKSLKQIENLVFQGGGVKGYAYLGALGVLLDGEATSRMTLAQIKRVAGASAGAITSFLLAIGYSFKELQQSMAELNFLDLLDDEPTTEPDFKIKDVVFALLKVVKAFSNDSSFKKVDIFVYVIYEYIKYKLKQKLGRSPTQAEVTHEATDWLQKTKDFFAAHAAPIKDYLGEILGNIWPTVLTLVLKALKSIITNLASIRFTAIEAKLQSTLKFSDSQLASFITGVFFTVDYLIKNKGLFSGDALLNWLKAQLKEKGLPETLTFSKLEEYEGTKELYIVALNLSKGHSEIFSAKTTPSVAIVDAVRVSLSIPFFFKSYVINHSLLKKYVYADGGTLDNYPVNIFDTSHDQTNSFFYIPEHLKQFNKRTLGLRLVNDAGKAYYEKGETSSSKVELEETSDLVSYAFALGYAIFEKQESDHRQSNDQPRTIYISTKEVSTVDFDLGKTQKESLIIEGKDGALNYLARAHHDEQYAQQFSRSNFWNSCLLAIGDNVVLSLALYTLLPIQLYFPATMFRAAAIAGGIAGVADISTKAMAFSRHRIFHACTNAPTEPGDNPIKIDPQQRAFVTATLSGLAAFGSTLFYVTSDENKSDLEPNTNLAIAIISGLLSAAVSAFASYESDTKYAKPYIARPSWKL